MNEATQKGGLSAEEKQRLIAFFDILIQIDRRVSNTKITKTSKGAVNNA